MTTKTIQFNDGGYWIIGKTVCGKQAHDMYFSFLKKCNYKYDLMIEIVNELIDSGDIQSNHFTDAGKLV